MFLDELTPVVKELVGQPLAFLGGFVSGALRLNLAEDPVKSWLDKQGGSSGNGPKPPSDSNGKGGGPQTISID